MKRYLVFAGLSYYPGGGWKDFRGDYDNYVDAKERTLVAISCGFDWSEIVDTVEKRVIEEYPVSNRY